MHYALLYLVYGGRHEADEVIEAADRAVHESSDDNELIGMLETAKAFNCISSGRLSEAVTHTDEAVQPLPPSNSYWRMNAAIYSAADLTGKALDHPLTSLTTSFKVAASLQHMGRNKEAEEIIRHTLLAARQRGHAMIPRAGLHWGLLGELLRERGELDEADVCVERGLAMSESERTAHGWTCLHALALAMSCGEYDRGADLIGRIESVELEASLPVFVTIPACALAARVQLGLDLPEAALKRLAALDSRLAGPPGAAGRSDRDVLREIERRAEFGEYVTMLIETRLVHAAVALAEDDVAESERLVRSAIEQGAGRGYFQTYADEVPLLSSVYRNLARTADEPEAVRRLAARICSGDVPPAREADPGSRAHEPAGSMDDLVEPLSPREIEILACVGRGLSNEETGEELFIRQARRRKPDARGCGRP